METPFSLDDFRALADDMPALCWIASGDGQRFWYNKRWTEYSGVELDEATAAGWQSLHDPATLADVVARWNACVADGTTFEALLSLRGRDGQYRPFWTRATPARDRAGIITRWYAASSEVTELHRAHAALGQSEARYRSAMTLGRMGAWEVDFATGVRNWTPEGMLLFGLDLPGGHGVVGGDADEFRRVMHPDDRHLQAQYHELANHEGSFSAEYRIVRADGQTRWMSGYGCALERTSDGRPQRMINVVVDVTEQKAKEEHTQFLLQELSHRSKNLLSVVQGIANQTARHVDTLEAFRKSFSDRLSAMAISQDALVHSAFNGGRVGELVKRQLAPFVAENDSRIKFDGDASVLTREAIEWLGLALHELTTNAVKYGALKSPSGELHISWRTNRAAGEPAFHFVWAETGGPLVEAPRKAGFGSTLMKIVGDRLGAKVATEHLPSGLRWSLSAPETCLADTGEL